MNGRVETHRSERVAGRTLKLLHEQHGHALELCIYDASRTPTDTDLTYYEVCRVQMPKMIPGCIVIDVTGVEPQLILGVNQVVPVRYPRKKVTTKS